MLMFHSKTREKLNKLERKKGSKKMSPNTTIKIELPCRLWAVDSLDRRAHLDQCLLLVCMLFYLDSTLCVQGDRQKNNTQKNCTLESRRMSFLDFSLIPTRTRHAESVAASIPPTPTQSKANSSAQIATLG